MERAECGVRFADLILNLVCHRHSLFVRRVVNKLILVGGSMRSMVYPLNPVKVVKMPWVLMLATTHNGHNICVQGPDNGRKQLEAVF